MAWCGGNPRGGRDFKRSSYLGDRIKHFADIFDAGEGIDSPGVQGLALSERNPDFNDDLGTAVSVSIYYKLTQIGLDHDAIRTLDDGSLAAFLCYSRSGSGAKEAGRG